MESVRRDDGQVRVETPKISEQDRNEMVLKHYQLARTIACRIYQRLPKTVDLEDLVSAAITGLIEAIERYDSTRAVNFETYAKHRIHGAVVDSLRSNDWVPRSVRRKNDLIERTRNRLSEKLDRRPTYDEMATELEVTEKKYDALVKDSQIRPLLSLDVPMGDDNPTPLIEQVQSDDDMMERWQHRELKDLMLKAVKHLPERERTAVGLYYLHEMSLKEVGHVLNVTESRACQLCSQGIKRLQYRLRRHLRN